MKLAGSFKCPICGYSASSKTGLSIHFGKLHRMSVDGFPLDATSLPNFIDHSSKKPLSLEFFSTEVSSAASFLNLFPEKNQSDSFGGASDDDVDFDYDHDLIAAGKHEDTTIYEEKLKTLVDNHLSIDNQNLETFKHYTMKKLSIINKLITQSELEFAELGIFHYMSRNCMTDVLTWSRNNSNDSPSEFQSVRSPKTIYKYLDKLYNLLLGKDTIKVLKIKIPKEFSGDDKKSIVFAFESPIEMIKSLILERNVNTDNLLLKYNPIFSKQGIPLFSDINSGLWYRQIESINSSWIKNTGGSICPVILYSDSTLVDKMSKRSFHPIMIQLGIHNYADRNKLCTKRLIGYLPQITAQHVNDKNKLSLLKRYIFHLCWKTIMEDIAPGTEISVTLGSERKQFKIYPMFFIADHPERLLIGGIRQSVSTNRPCPNCEITLKELAEKGPCFIGLPRKEIDMSLIRNSSDPSQLKAYSIHSENPFGNGFFTSHRGGLYDALLPCLMHTFARITHYILNYSIKAVEKYGIQEDCVSDKAEKTQTMRLAELESRFSKMPYFRIKKKSTLVMKNGVVTLANLTAREKKSILFQLKFVFGSDIETFIPLECGVKIVNLLILWEAICKVFWVPSGKKVLSEKDLQFYTKKYKVFINDFQAIFTMKEQSLDQKILFHAAAHFPEYVVPFGNPKNFSSDSLEKAHGPMSKKVFKITQRQSDASQQMLRYHRRSRTLLEIRGLQEDFMIESKVENLDLGIISKRERQRGVKRKNLVDIFEFVPAQRIESYLKQLIDRKKGVIDFQSNGFEFVTSINHNQFGKITVSPCYGKHKEEIAPFFFIESDIKYLATFNSDSDYDINIFLEYFEEGKLFLGKAFGIIRLNNSIDDKEIFCVLFAHMEPVNSKSLYHSLLNEGYVQFSKDTKSSSTYPIKFWWDLCFLDDLIAPAHLIPDFEDKSGCKYFIDSCPIMF